MRFVNKVVIVTGGARGIGRGIAAVFVKNGAKVVVADILEREGQTTVAELNKLSEEKQDKQDKHGGESVFKTCDLRIEEDIKKLIDFTVATYGRIDCLVNNAAIATTPAAKAIDDTTPEEFQQVYRVNVLAPMLCSKHALPHLRTTHGSIVNISSSNEKTGLPGSAAYVSSKGAISAFCRALALDESSNGVRVNNVCPGAIWSDFSDQLFRQSPNYEKAVSTARDLSVFGRFGTTEEIGHVLSVPRRRSDVHYWRHVHGGQRELSEPRIQVTCRFTAYSALR